MPISAVSFSQGVEKNEYLFKLYAIDAANAPHSFSINFSYASTSLSYSGIKFTGSSAVSSSASLFTGNGTVQLSGQFTSSAPTGQPFATISFSGVGTGSFDLNFSKLIIDGLTPTFIDPGLTSYEIVNTPELLAVTISEDENYSGSFQPFSTSFSNLLSSGIEPTHGVLTTSTSALSGNQWNYVPAANFFGEDVFSVIATYFGESKILQVSVIVLPVNDPPTGAISITGTLVEGKTISISSSLADVDGITSVSYQWYADGIEISKANDQSYSLTQSEIGRTISVTGTYIDGSGTVEAVRSASTKVIQSRINVGTDQSDVFSYLFNGQTFDGGAGIDIAEFSGPRSSFSIQHFEETIGVSELIGGRNSSLTNVERMKFQDYSVAFDLKGNAGMAAKLLGVVLGKESVSNREYSGIVLYYLDSGFSIEEVMQLALTNVLGTNATNIGIVNLLYFNLIGHNPSQEELSQLGQLLNDGTYTPAGLGVAAADHALNESNINLVGLSQTGLEFLPFG